MSLGWQRPPHDVSRYPRRVEPEALVVLILGLLLLTSCARVHPVVKVGLVGPFEGRYRSIGYDAIYSARLAVREVNARGGIGGYRVALVAMDDGGDSELAIRTAAAMTSDPSVSAVVGHWLPETTSAAAALYADAGLPFIDTSQDPFATREPGTLPAVFLEAYQQVSPFDETAGLYAGSTYLAFRYLWLAMESAASSSLGMSREGVYQGLSALSPNLVGELVFPLEGE